MGLESGCGGSVDELPIAQRTDQTSPPYESTCQPSVCRPAYPTAAIAAQRLSIGELARLVAPTDR
ncbi:hypothetical protein [Oculatella sp. LEGE 06141]|uniref:hypothetical protein n=1 Tax=Oculatella sp. LEGE 06141 TaxID=1828648 RepID=UPI001D135041|nr:hypothetical protein [Oculatella sp. LEGE 06141]